MATLESISKAIDSRIDRDINLFNEKFERILLDIQREVEIRSVQLISDPLSFDFEFQRILNDTGYYNLIDELVNGSYDNYYDDILKAFELGGIAVAFDSQDLEKINAIKKLDLDFFRSNGLNAGETLKANLYKYTLSNTTAKEIADNMKETFAGTNLAKYSKTYAETAISNFQQSVINLKAVDIDSVWIYIGINDKLTREFCKCVLNQKKYYSNIEKNKIENNPHRRWNCRHQLLPISQDRAIETGYQSGSATC